MVSIQELYELFLQNPKVTKDTREEVKGSIYFALTGPNFNGNKFAEEALAQGAAYAVVDDLSVLNQPDHPKLLHVENVLRSLQQLASFHRDHIQAPVLAITGSNGKTTTKELVAKVLSKKFKVHYTKGNYNNHIGLPLTILQIHPKVEFVVLEMGASAQKEIAGYCTIAKPDYGLITNVGRAHLEGFGGEEGVRKGKGELYDYLAKNQGVVFVNSDEPFLDRMAQRVSDRMSYHSGAQAQTFKKNIAIQLVRTEPNVICRFRGNDQQEYMIESTLMGRHNFMNIMSAVAVGTYFEVPDLQIKRAIELYQPTNNRSQIFRFEGVKYVKDAYNANPDSMKSMVQSFAAWKDPHKVLVLGDMLELGSASEEAHQQIVDLVTQLQNIEEVYLVGDQFCKTLAPSKVRKYLTVDALLKEWKHATFRGKTVLLKGSRGIALEKLVDL